MRRLPRTAQRAAPSARARRPPTRGSSACEEIAAAIDGPVKDLLVTTHTPVLRLRARTCAPTASRAHWPTHRRPDAALCALRRTGARRARSGRSPGSSCARSCTSRGPRRLLAYSPGPPRRRAGRACARGLARALRRGRRRAGGCSGPRTGDRRRTDRRRCARRARRPAAGHLQRPQPRVGLPPRA